MGIYSDYRLAYAWCVVLFKTLVTMMYLDIMLNGSFYSQIKIVNKQEYSDKEIKDLVLGKFPSLVGKKHHFEFSNQKL